MCTRVNLWLLQMNINNINLLIKMCIGKTI